MLGLVWMLYASFGLVSNSMAPLVTPIIHDLGLDYTRIGTILGAWQLVYIAVASSAGVLIDRMGLRKALGIGILFIGLSAVLRGMANSYETLFLFVAIFGLGGPMISIGAPKLVSVWFQGKSRATAVGIYSMASQVGAVISMTAANSVVMPLTGGNWRLVFGSYAAVVFVAAAVWWIFAREAPSAAAISGAARKAATQGYRYLLGLRNVRLVLVITLSAFISSHATNVWLFKILQQRGGLSDDQAGFWAAVPIVVVIFSAPTVPHLAPVGKRRLVIAGMLLAYAMAAMVLATAHGPVLLVGLILQGIARGSVTALLMLTLMDTPEVGSEHMAVAGGLYFTVGEVGGFAGPSLLGWLRDASGDFVAGLVVLAALNIAMMSFAFLIRETKPTAPA